MCVLRITRGRSTMGRKRLIDLRTKPTTETHVDKKPRRQSEVALSHVTPNKDSIDIDNKSDDQFENAAHEFEAHVFDLWLSNKKSAKDAKTHAQKASAAGAKGVSHIASIGGKSNDPKNFARDLKGQAKRRNKLSPLYWAAIPSWNQDTKSCDMVDIPFFLPFELIFVVLQNGMICLATICSVIAGSHLHKIKQDICARLQVRDPTSHVLIGLHTDGVPMQKSGASIEVQSFNFPNMPSCERNLWDLFEKHMVLSMRL